MTERELKKQLKNVYSFEESNSGKAFVRKHEQRGMHLGEIMLLETKYLGLRSAGCGLALCLMLFLIAKTGSVHSMWVLSSILPICVLACITAIDKSERYGMGEFEATSRFSLRMIIATRMMILGIFSLVIIVLGTVVIKSVFDIGLLQVLNCICLPYLLNIMGCLIVIRRWHARENIYGCCGVTFATCIIPYLVERSEYISSVSQGWIGAVMVLVLIVTIVECILYFRESESLSWNLY